MDHRFDQTVREEDVLGGEDRPGQSDGRNGIEIVASGRNGRALHTVSGAEEEDLSVRVNDLDLIRDGDGWVNVAAGTTTGEHHTKIS